MGAGAQPVPSSSTPPPGVTFGPPVAAPPPGVTFGPPVGSGNASTPPPASQDDTLTGNPNNEGTYQMKGPKGDTVMVPYSKVGTIAHDQGYSLVGDGTFHTTGDAARYWKDYGADPHTVQNVKDFYKATQDPGQGVEIGAARGAALTAAGLAHITRKVTGKVTGQDTQQGTTEKALQDFGDDSNTGAEDFGKFVESAGEFLMGDEALKGLSYLDKLKQIMPVLKSVEKSPLLARVLDAAIQQGTVGGAQGFVKSGGNPEAAAEEGAASAGTAGLLTGATEAISSAMARTAPATETIEGVPVQTISSQRPGTGPRGDVKINEVPKVAAGQQDAAPRVFQNIAQRATRDALEEANAGRRVVTAPPNRMLPAPADMQPYTFTIPGTGTAETVEGDLLQPAAKAPRAAFKEPQFTTSSADIPTVEGTEGSFGADIATGRTPQPGEDVVRGGGDVVTASPETAQMHLSRLNELVDHPPADVDAEQLKAITEARDQLQEQMDMYHTYQRTLPNFAPIDSARAAQGVNTFGDMEDQLQNAAGPMYKAFNEATDGAFGKLQQQRMAAGARGDFATKFAIERQMDALLDSTPRVSAAERAQATRLWEKSKIAGAFDDVIENAANVRDRYASQVQGGRSLSGTKLQNGLQKLIENYGPARLEAVVGRDGMENMTRMADLLKEQPKGGFQQLSANVVHNLIHGKVGAGLGAALGASLHGYEGATAGAMMGVQAERFLLRAAATNPRVGQMVDYAVRNGVSPRIAAALVAEEIRREGAAQQTQQQPDGGTQ